MFSTIRDEFSHFKDEFSLKQIGRDLPASIAVFLVAVPLCLGIAHASQTPLLSGLIAGILGGIVVGVDRRELGID